MNEHPDHGDLERRLRPWLQAAAPHPSNDFTNQVLRQSAAMPQRGTWTMRFGLPAMAAAAVAAVALVVGLQLGQIGPIQIGPFGSNPSPTATPASTSSTSPTAPQPAPSASASAQAYYRCENSAEGYAVDVPEDWFANPEVTAREGGDDIPACRYFAPNEFEVRPNSGLPSTVAIGFQLVDAIAPAGGTELSSSEATVDGHDALVREVEITEGGFLPAGTLVYEYYVTLDDGRNLWISTDSSRNGSYDDHREVMDQMMETLEILP
jgi:hypothetical protein